LYGREAIALGDIVVVPADSVKSLGATFDVHFSMRAQVTNVVRICNYHIRQLGRIRKNISASACHAAVQALIISRLDYCNVLLAGLPANQVRRLQKVQNRAARLIVRADKTAHTTPIMRDLHWLPVSERIKFKVLMYAFKALHGLAPVYVNSLLDVYIPGRCLRSVTGGTLLNVPKTKKKAGEAAFSSVAPRLWNALPQNVRAVNSKTGFKKLLKTHLFSSYYS
jgi:hypothetical protein